MRRGAPIAAAAAAVVIALGARLAAAAGMAVLQPDGCYYVWMAEDFAAGRIADALAWRPHPLYPALAAGLAAATGASLEGAARAVSIALGSLAAAPLFFAVRRASASDGAALAAALLYAVHPYAVRSGADVMAEATLLFFVALAAAGAARSGATGALACGAGAGLAYLARPEGLVVAVAAAAVALGRRAPARAAAIALAAVLVAAPYAAWLSREAGALTLTRKQSVAALGKRALAGEGARTSEADLRSLVTRSDPGATDGDGVPASRLARILGAARVTADRFLHVYHPALAILALAGIIHRARAARIDQTAAPGAAAVLVLAAALFLALGFLVKAGAGYVHKRHLLAPACLLLFLTGDGAAALARTRLRAGALALALAAVLLPKALWPQFEHRRGLLDAAAALRAREDRVPGPGPALVASHYATEIAYYAGAREIPLPEGSAAEVIARARAAGARYLAFVLRARAAPSAPRAEAALAALGLEPFYRADEAVAGRFYRRVIYDLREQRAGAGGR